MTKQGNLKLWNAVCSTPPEHTKDVRYGKRKYTAVDPQWQMRVATSLWGPYGTDWGFRDLEYSIVDMEDQKIAILHATFYYPPSGSFPVVNEMQLRVGDEVFKKLVTNTRSKALSWLGFSADVFMGKFEDTGYARSMAERFSGENSFVKRFVATIQTAKNLERCDDAEAKIKQMLEDGQLTPLVARELSDLVVERRSILMSVIGMASSEADDG